MKTLITLSFLFIVALTFGQAKTELPNKEFTIQLSESSLTIKPGETKQVNVLLNRSMYFAKEKATLGFLSSLPQGITITYEPKEGNFDSSIATITAAAEAGTGVHQIVLSALLSTKKKGTILKLTVSNEQVAVK